jgi:hypothetical protein
VVVLVVLVVQACCDDGLVRAMDGMGETVKWWV